MIMKKDGANITEKVPANVIDIMAEVMLEFREDMENFDAVGTKIAAKTRFIMRVVFGLLALSSLYLGYMIFYMASNMTAMTKHLEDMYSNFGVMSQNMHEITQSVGYMSANISGMPQLSQSMSEIDLNVRAMNVSVFEINRNISAINNDMLKINNNMQMMTGRMANMNRTLYLIGDDVNEMAAPINSGPMSGMWPR